MAGVHARFVADEAQLERFGLGVKLQACPHCGRHGTLNAHAFVTGYAEAGQGRVLRGRRFFCSNRHRRPGCGRTFSVRLAHVIPAFVVSARTLTRFVKAVLGGESLRAAWARLVSMPCQSGYRLWRRLSRAQAHLRSALCRLAMPPPCASREPLAQLLAHLQHVLPGESCELSGFQLRFQVSLLP